MSISPLRFGSVARPTRYSPTHRTLTTLFAIGLFCGCWAMPQRHSAASAPTANGRIVIDGAMGDWGAAPTVKRARDAGAAGADPASADVVAVSERSDGHYIYLRLDLARPTSLYGLSGTVSIDIDSDDNATTGANADGLAGTDLSIDLSPMVNGHVVEGVAIRAMRAGSIVKTTDSYPLDFVLLPTYASASAELRIARGRLVDSSSAPVLSGRSYRAQIAVHGPDGALLYRLPTFTATLPPLDTMTRAATRDPLARSPNTQFRALVWNVANEGIRDRAEHYRRIIAAIDPDLLILDEVGGVIGREGTGKFLASIDSGRTRAPWSYTYGAGGGYQRTVIATRTTVTEFPEFRFIPFPDSTAARLLAAVPAPAREKQRANIADGVATGGAMVTLNGKHIAVFGVDLQSAGNALGSWQEARRQAETRIIRDEAIAAIKAHGPVDAVIAAGDHNLVGTREPLNIMAEIGGAFDGASLAHAEVLQLDSATAATWDGSGGPYPPGRLDWFGYTASALAVTGGFVFDVADLSDQWRVAHHLQADDSKHSSDHRPVVVDVRWLPGRR